MRRLPIRVRLTAAFATAMLLVLLAAEQPSSPDRRRDQCLPRGRPSGRRGLGGPGGEFRPAARQIGEVLESGGEVIGPAILPDEVRQSRSGPVLVERELPGVDGPVRILVTGITVDDRPLTIVIGQSLLDRNEALASVVNSFGGLTSLLLASVAGYGLARAGLAPVEAMRRRASEISIAGSAVGLPMPPARDEVRRLGETLNAMLARIRDAFERERRFVADASHELRTPLAVMRTEIDGALLRRPAEPDVRLALLAVRSECTRLTRLATTS